jgi:alkylhydroperoxidase/carboxymuconolactone decarboxylase family protein YurZ
MLGKHLISTVIDFSRPMQAHAFLHPPCSGLRPDCPGKIRLRIELSLGRFKRRFADHYHYAKRLAALQESTSRIKVPATPGSNTLPSTLTTDDVRTVAPALERYRQGLLLGDLWKRPALSPRDRSIITLAALIARNQVIEMPYHLNLALDNGVRANEISEVITHLAFYSGWANAMSAVAVAKRSLASVTSEPLSLLRPQVSFFPLMTPPRRNARPVFSMTSAPWLRESCSTPATYCSMTCGYVRTWRPATGALLPLALSSPRAKSRKSRITSIERWITA